MFLGESGLVAIFCLPVCSPWPGVVVEPTTETKMEHMEPNEFNSWGHQLQQGHHQIVTFVFLLLLVALSISLVCWFVVLSCRLLFFSSPLRCQVFCPLRLTLEGCAKNMEPNRYRKISHVFFSLRCFGFRNLHSFFEGNEGFSGRITQNGQVLTFFFG